jgi:hypothetical protein
MFLRSLIKDIEAHYQDPNKPYPSEESPLMSELSTYLESAGIHDPMKKVHPYIKELTKLTKRIQSAYTQTLYISRFTSQHRELASFLY